MARETTQVSASYTPIQRQLVPDSIARQVQQMIASRALKPGDKIATERELAAALGVSRTAVREAVKSMVAVGILEVRQGVGTFVATAQRPPLDDTQARQNTQSASQKMRIGDLVVTPLTPHIGGRVDGVDLRGELSPSMVRSVEDAMDHFAVLVFSGQTFDDDSQFAFGSQFGKIEDVPTAVDQERRRLANKQINDITNVGVDGKILPAADRRRMYNLGNRLWHSDSSFKPVPAKYSMLHARVIPPEGGETEFADMRAAWDALPSKMKEKSRDLVCEHSVIFSRYQLGFSDFTEAEKARCAPVRQRLVRRHESSGRTSLFLSSHIGRIEGWPIPEALDFIRDLTEFATQRQFVYAHNWTVGDLVIWDNRATMHRVRRYEDQTYPRELRRVTVQGSFPTIDP